MPSIRNVTLARVGHYDISTGPATFTLEKFKDAVAASHDPDVGEAIIRPGHTDPRFDGSPACGRVANMRVEGDRLVGDLMDLPGWLAPRMRASYPNRSIDGWTNVKTRAGKQYSLVVTGLALLGITAPGIQGLGDLPAAIAASADTEHVAATVEEMGLLSHLRARKLNKVQAATTRDVERAFGETQAGRNGAWVVDLDLDASAAIVVDVDGDYYRIPYSVASGGEITFDTPAKVRLNYVDAPDDDDSDALDAGEVAASSPGDPQPASTVSDDEGQGGPQMDLAKMRAALGLPADADEATVMAEVTRLAAGKGETPPAGTPPTPPTPPPPTPPASQPAQPTAPVPVAGQPAGAPVDQRVPVAAAALPGTTVIDTNLLAALQVQASQGAQAFADARARAKEEFFTRHSNRVTPGSKELRASLGTIFDADPAQAERTVLELPVAVPTAPTGYGGDTSSPTDQGFTSPEEATVWSALVQTSPFLAAAVAAESADTQNGAAGA